SGRENGRPCTAHARAARSKYLRTLEAIGCVCRVLIALGQESCCPPRKPTSVERKRSSKNFQLPHAPCCVSGSCTGPGPTKTPSRPHTSHHGTPNSKRSSKP